MNDPKDTLDQKKHQLFCLNFEKHVSSFMKEHDLIHPDKKIILSVSGGVDSCVLASLFHKLGKHFELLHFNHGTRPAENLLEENHVLNWGLKHNILVNVFHFDLSLDQKNFEKVARLKRREIYQQYIDNGYWVYTAHHIDDSFEWSLMQSFKQSSVKSTLGIPVWSQGIVRPFMSATKKQIYRYARASSVKWIEDKSNLNSKFERNYLRIYMTSKILKRYPKALRHYVSRQNELALMENCHRLKSPSDLVVVKEESGSVILISDHLENHKKSIKEFIHKKSNNSRGEIDLELDKLLSAHKIIMSDKRSFPFKGPMSFSGGVCLYLLKNKLFIASQNELDFYRQLDERLKNHLAQLTQIPDIAFSSSFPQLIISGTKKLKRSSNYLHPLLPVTCEWLKHQGISYGFDPLMDLKDRQMLIHDAVILDSFVVG